MALKKVLSFTVICLIGCYTTIFAQTLSAPPWPITSDFGPRNVTDGSWFHQGIDYGGGYGDPININPVEGGNINRIEYLEGGWNLRIAGGLGSWEYIHIFSGTGEIPPPSENWELRAKLYGDCLYKIRCFYSRSS